MTEKGVIEVEVTCPECGEPLEVDRSTALWTAGAGHECLYDLRDEGPADYEEGVRPALPVAFKKSHGWVFYDEKLSLELVGSDL